MSSGLIYITVFSYLAAAVATLAGFPAMESIGTYPVDAATQGAFYLAMAILLGYAFIHPEARRLRYLLAAMYGVVAMLSSSGIQVWINYAGSNAYLGPAMALWDITLALVLLKEAEG